jgi:hypothetical protein
MGISNWIAIAQRDAKSYRTAICEACGAETLTGDGIAFCSNCESVVGSDSKTVEGTNPALFSSVGSIRTAVSNNDFEAAAAIYDRLLKDRQSPQLLYAKGIMQIEHSNYVVSQIGYGGEGFMERNSELREMGARLVSDGKRLVARSLSVSESEARDAPSVYAFYRMFLCALKMHNLRAARSYSGRIAELEKEGAVSLYAKVVLYVYGGLYREAGRELDRLAKMKNPPANAFYYAAFVAFKTGDRGGAERLLKVSGGLIEERKRANMLQAIKEDGA